MDTKSEKNEISKTQLQEKSPKFHKYGIRHVQMACMCLCSMALYMSRSTISVAVLAMTDIHRRNDTQIYDWDKKTQGIILSSFYWGYVVMQIPAGILAKNFGGKPIFLSALLLNGTICLFIPAMAKFGSWPLVCASRVLMGLSQACLLPATHTLVGQWAPANERTTFSGIIYGCADLSIVISLPLSGVLADTAMGWKLIFFSLGGLLIFVAFVYYFTTASTPRQHKWISIDERDYIESGLNKTTKAARTPWREILTTRQFWGILMAHYGTAFSYTIFFVDMPTYLEKGLGMSLKSSASLAALPYVAMAVVDISTCTICDKIVNRNFVKLATCRKIMNSLAQYGGALCLIALAFVGSENKIVAMAMLIFTLSIAGFSNAGFLCNHLDLSPNFAGVMLSLTNTVSNTGSIMAPIVTSSVLRNDPTDVSRWRIVFLITAAMLTVANTGYVTFTNSDRQKWDDPNYRDKQTADPEEIQPAIKEKDQEDKKICVL